MKQAAELLEEALKEAGGSLDEIGNNPLFSGSAVENIGGTPSQKSAVETHLRHHADEPRPTGETRERITGIGAEPPYGAAAPAKASPPVARSATPAPVATPRPVRAVEPERAVPKNAPKGEETKRIKLAPPPKGRPNAGVYIGSALVIVVAVGTALYKRSLDNAGSPMSVPAAVVIPPQIAATPASAPVAVTSAVSAPTVPSASATAAPVVDASARVASATPAALASAKAAVPVTAPALSVAAAINPPSTVPSKPSPRPAPAPAAARPAPKPPAERPASKPKPAEDSDNPY
jgi:hypothetical protein